MCLCARCCLIYYNIFFTYEVKCDTSSYNIKHNRFTAKKRSTQSVHPSSDRQKTIHTNKPLKKKNLYKLCSAFADCTVEWENTNTNTNRGDRRPRAASPSPTIPSDRARHAPSSGTPPRHGPRPKNAPTTPGWDATSPPSPKTTPRRRRRRRRL